MKRFLLLASFIAFVSAPMFAKNWRLQFDDQNIGSVDFPDSWQVDQSREFIEGWSPDKSAHVVLQISPARSADKSNEPHRIAPDGTDVEGVFAELGADRQQDEMLEGLVKDFKDDEVVVDGGTKKERKLRGGKGWTFDGKREGKPVSAGVGAMALGNTHSDLTFTYWVMKENENQRQPEIGQILQSIRSAK